MKKLTRFILASYFRPFIRSLIISLFLLVLQFLSRYKDDLFGKGLDADTIAKIFAYASVSLIVLALPVSVLLASLFTMGTFGEQYELAAMRSSGLSTRKIISPMIVLTLFVSLVSFSLSSYIIPITNLKLYSLLYDVKQLKPTFSLEPGHFNSDIDNYVIRIEDKDVSKEMLYNIMIYDHTSGRGNDRMVMADSGVMKVDPYGSFMNMWLFDGASFENNYTDKGRVTEKESFVRTHYKALYYTFDLSGFSLERTAESDFASHHYMLNLNDLNFSMDTVMDKRDSMVVEYRGYVEETSKIDSAFLDIPDSTLSIPPDKILLTFPKYKRREVMRRALSSASSMQKASELTASRFEEKELRYRNYLIEFHAKFSLPVACIIFLFIGAPLGALVRKGGVGIPILVSVTFYLAFYVIMIQGKKMATEAVVPVWIGVWLPILVLFPLAVLFTYQAASMRKLQFGQFFFSFRNYLQDFLVFILRPVVRLFKGKQVPVARTERHITILPDDLTLPDQTRESETELARWERELGLSSGDEGEVSVPDMRGDEDELARMERELGISLRGNEDREETREETKEETKEETREETREEKETGKEKATFEASAEAMELPDMRGDEDELARMERELGISLRGDEDREKKEAEEETETGKEGETSEAPMEAMELPDMRGDEDELARMERELGISLRGDEDREKKETEIETETETEKEKEIATETETETETEKEIEKETETEKWKEQEEDELTRWERELGISFTSQPGPMDLESMPGLNLDRIKAGPDDPEVANLDLDFSIDLDMEIDLDEDSENSPKDVDTGQ